MGTVTEQVKTGLKELPSNVFWVVSKMRHSSNVAAGNGQDMVHDARVRAREKAKDLKEAITEASPLGGDESAGQRMRRARDEGSVEVRMEQARQAARRAETAEGKALALAREAEALAQHARQVGEEGTERIKQTEQGEERNVTEQLAEAKRDAEKMLEERERTARAEADHRVAEVRERAQAEAEAAQGEAEQAQARAEEAMGEATEAMAEARRRAEEAKRAAGEAAAQAQRQAEQLAAEADVQARDAEEQIEVAKEIRQRAEETAKEAAREIKSSSLPGDLESHTKEELLDLAAAMDLQGRSRMSKEELVSALSESSEKSAK